MDTLVIIRDSVAVMANKTALVCQPCVNDAETKINDVIIVLIICASILIIAIYAIKRYFKWKDDERNARKESENEKTEQERTNRIEKQQADLKAKLLSHLERHLYTTEKKELTEEEQKSEKEKEKEKYKETRQYNEKAGEKYVKTLTAFIDGKELSTDEQKK